MNDEDRYWPFYEVCFRDPSSGSLNGPYGGVQSNMKVSPEKALEQAQQLGRSLYGDDSVVREGNPDHLQRWGYGNEPWKPFDTVAIEGVAAELGFGQHPHSRNDNMIYAKLPAGGTIVGFAGHRPILKVVVEDHNRYKKSYLSGDQIRRSTGASVWANDMLIYRTSRRDTAACLVHVADRIPWLLEHPAALWDKKSVDRLVGRSVKWRNESGQIVSFDREELTVRIEARTPSGVFRAPPWHEGPGGSDVSDESSVTTDVYDHNVWWS